MEVIMNLETSICFSAARNFAVATSKESEIKQGKSYYQASALQIAQIFNLTTVFARLTDKIPEPSLRILAKVCNNTLPAASVALCPIFAAVKQGHYEGLVKGIKTNIGPKLSSITNLLPDKLSEGTTTVINYLAENTGDIMRMSMLATAAAMPFLGSSYYAGAIIAPVVYEAMDSWNWIPRKVSLFIENYMPIATDIVLLAGGGLMGRIASAASLLYNFSNSRPLHQKIDNYNQYYSSCVLPPSSMSSQEQTITIEDVDSQWVISNVLSYNEIEKILEDGEMDYMINPAHCSKSLVDFSKLPEDCDFSKLILFLNKVDWEKRYPLLKHSFFDDDRFIDELKTCFPKNYCKENFEEYITQLANKKNVSKEKFLAGRLHEQMGCFIDILNGKVRVKGSQQDLQDTILNAAKILGYLNGLDLKIKSQQIELEDILIKLAVEGGEYCGRGLKRASGEILNGIIAATCKGHAFNPYEFRLLFSLQQSRERIAQGMYQKYIEIVVRAIKEGVQTHVSLRSSTTDKTSVKAAQDVHTAELFFHLFAFGFIPMTENERNRISMQDIIMWGSPFQIYRPFRNEMYKNYYRELDATVRENGEQSFSAYIRDVIVRNPLLSEEKKEAVMEKFTSCNNGMWSVWETHEKFHRLMLVMLGIIRRKNVEWLKIDLGDLPEYESEQKVNAGSVEDDWIMIDEK